MAGTDKPKDVQYRILPEHQLIVEEITGMLTIERIYSKTEKLMADEAFKPGYSGISDLRRADPHLTRVELYGFAELIKKYPQSPESGKWAVVVSDPMMKALTELMQRLVTGPTQIGVFSTVDEAARFLDKPVVKELLAPD